MCACLGVYVGRRERNRFAFFPLTKQAPCASECKGQAKPGFFYPHWQLAQSNCSLTEYCLYIHLLLNHSLKHMQDCSSYRKVKRTSSGADITLLCYATTQTKTYWKHQAARYDLQFAVYSKNKVPYLLCTNWRDKAACLPGVRVAALRSWSKALGSEASSRLFVAFSRW